MDLFTLVGMVAFGAAIFPVAFPEKTNRIKKAARLTREHMDNAARSASGKYLGGYQTQKQARSRRTRIKPGETIYFPDGSHIDVEPGLKDVQVAGYWYAWDAR